MSEEPKFYYQYVSSITGRTVSAEDAAANQDTTYKRKVFVKRKEVELPDVVLDDAPIEEEAT